jgi:hypothetical protein
VLTLLGEGGAAAGHHVAAGRRVPHALKKV